MDLKVPEFDIDFGLEFDFDFGLENSFDVNFMFHQVRASSDK